MRMRSRLVVWVRRLLGIERDGLVLANDLATSFSVAHQRVTDLEAALGQYAENERQMAMRLADLDARLRYYEAHDESIRSLAKKRLNGHTGTHILRIGQQ